MNRYRALLLALAAIGTATAITPARAFSASSEDEFVTKSAAAPSAASVTALIDWKRMCWLCRSA